MEKVCKASYIALFLNVNEPYPNIYEKSGTKIPVNISDSLAGLAWLVFDPNWVEIIQ